MISNEIKGFLEFGLNEMKKQVREYERQHDRLIDQWDATKKMPRKKKKKERKRVLLLWSMNEWYGQLIGADTFDSKTLEELSFL